MTLILPSGAHAETLGWTCPTFGCVGPTPVPTASPPTIVYRQYVVDGSFENETYDVNNPPPWSTSGAFVDQLFANCGSFSMSLAGSSAQPVSTWQMVTVPAGVTTVYFSFWAEWTLSSRDGLPQSLTATLSTYVPGQAPVPLKSQTVTNTNAGVMLWHRYSLGAIAISSSTSPQQLLVSFTGVSTANGPWGVTGYGPLLDDVSLSNSTSPIVTSYC